MSHFTSICQRVFVLEKFSWIFGDVCLIKRFPSSPPFPISTPCAMWHFGSSIKRWTVLLTPWISCVSVLNQTAECHGSAGCSLQAWPLEVSNPWDFCRNIYGMASWEWQVLWNKTETVILPSQDSMLLRDPREAQQSQSVVNHRNK